MPSAFTWVRKYSAFCQRRVRKCGSRFEISTAPQHRMRFVDKHARAVRFGHAEQFVQLREIPVHGINPLDNDQRAFPFSTLQRGIEGSRIVMLEPIQAAPRKHGAVAEAKM